MAVNTADATFLAQRRLAKWYGWKLPPIKEEDSLHRVRFTSEDQAKPDIVATIRETARGG